MHSVKFDENTYKKCVLVYNLPSGVSAEKFSDHIAETYKLKANCWKTLDDTSVVFGFNSEKESQLAMTTLNNSRFKRRFIQTDALNAEDTPIVPEFQEIKQGEAPSDEEEADRKSDSSESSEKPSQVAADRKQLAVGPEPTWTEFKLQETKALELLVPFFHLDDALSVAQAFPEAREEVRDLFATAQGFAPYKGAAYRSAAASSGVYGSFFQPWGAQSQPSADSVIAPENQFLDKLFTLGDLTKAPARAVSLALAKEPEQPEIEEEEEEEVIEEKVEKRRPELQEKRDHLLKRFHKDEDVFAALLQDKHDGTVATKYGSGNVVKTDHRVTSVEIPFGTVFAPKKKIHPMLSFKEMLAKKLQKYKETFHKKWGSGVGYGSSHTNDTKAWSVRKWMKSEEQRRAKIKSLFSELSDFLKVGGDKQKMDWILQSSFVPALAEYMKNDSLQDMGSRYSLYKEVLKTIGKLISVPELMPLLFEKHSDVTLAEAISRMFPAAKMVTQFGDEEVKEDDSNGKIALQITQVYQQLLDQIDRMMKLIGMMKAISGDTSEEQNSLIPGLCALKEQIENGFKKEMNNASKEDYEAIMRELCFDSVEELSSFPGHKYASSKSNPRRKVLKRLAAEYSDFETCLPIHEESSVFFRFCDESMCHAQMLIIAVDDTPYATGCFIFDIKFPDNYPMSPPKVNLQTTGRGAVRFNPNLYNCGKVCLSLLGTWSGRSEGEKWNPGLSTFLQVAISIQSLIFVPEPYFNEPGWERYMGTADGDRRSKQYNVVIEKGTTQYAIIEQIENPPAQWKDVIHTHFRMQSARVMKNVTKWHGKDHKLTKQVEGLLQGLQEKKAESPLAAPKMEKRTSDGA
jgi:ubiquitin-protein ligase